MRNRLLLACLLMLIILIQGYSQDNKFSLNDVDFYVVEITGWEWVYTSFYTERDSTLIKWDPTTPSLKCDLNYNEIQFSNLSNLEQEVHKFLENENYGMRITLDKEREVRIYRFEVPMSYEIQICDHQPYLILYDAKSRDLKFQSSISKEHLTEILNQIL